MKEGTTTIQKKWGLQNKNKQKATVLGHIRVLPLTTEMLFVSPAYFLCKGSHIFEKHTVKHAQTHTYTAV